MNLMRLFLLALIKADEDELYEHGVFFILATFLYSTTIRTRSYITSASLQDPYLSAGYHLYINGGERDFISSMGIDRRTFGYLFHCFDQFYFVRSGPGQVGRPSKFFNKGTVLACLLYFYTGTMESKTLCTIFGVPPSTLSRIMQNAELALEKCLRTIPEARFSWPSFTEQQEWAMRVKQKEPLLDGIWGFVDGKNYRVQVPTDSDLQNAMYNGKIIT